MTQPRNLGENEERLWALIERSPSPGKHAARSAGFHLERAGIIRDSDPTMAMFRLITAEEEAARAIFHALQRRRYALADRLRWRDHRHKAATLPFLTAIMQAVRREAGVVAPQLFFDGTGSAKVLRVRFKMTIDGEEKWVLPEPPLEFVIHIDGRRFDFRPEMELLLRRDQVVCFADLVKHRANQRNRLLYASDQGVPRVPEIPKATSDRFFSAVYGMLATFVLIDQNDRQQFVQQALNGFLKLLDLLPDIEFA